ncbi:Uncharacterized protein FKW44_023092 [Caligus rogercresseyi]|uniref:Uncharacterized protein n=1 Tax=Caligus rogercresseyi TaxID=217165 RepID=A0A7T8GNG5_CALRO|nr:Uncharacterized protein FKW44_023092 [Caligus rogercresseyi]
MSIRRKGMIENDSGDDDFQHPEKLSLPSFVLDLREAEEPFKPSIKGDPVERILSIERLPLQYTQMDQFTLESSSLFPHDGKGEKCFETPFRTVSICIVRETLWPSDSRKSHGEKRKPLAC